MAAQGRWSQWRALLFGRRRRGRRAHCRAPAGSSTAPLRHMYTEATYVVSGHGSTSVWRDKGAKQTFEWGPGSYFVLPTNAWHQFFNASLSRSARAGFP